MKQAYFVVHVGYAPAPAIGEPSPTEADGTAKIFLTRQGPEASDVQQTEDFVREQFARSKPDMHIVSLNAIELDETTYQTQRIMNLSKGKKTL